MPNATPRDTRAGFDIYRGAGGDISLDALNDQLLQAGYGPVSPRTHRHYRNLLEAGFNRYVSINRFDVARASAPYENASAKARYTYQHTDLGVRVIFAKSNKLLETFGRATEVGEVGAMLTFDEDEVVAGLQLLKPQPGDMVTVRYLEAGRTVGGRVVEADVRAEPATIEIEYAELISIGVLELGDPLPLVDARFVLRGAEQEPPTLDATSRRLFHFFEVVEGMRAIVNRAGARLEHQVYAEPPLLRSLSVASPADLTIEIADQLIRLFPWGLMAGALKITASLPEMRKTWHEGTGAKKDNQLKDFQLEREQVQADQAAAEARVRDAVAQRLVAAFPDADLSVAAAERYVDEFLLPPLRSLGQAGVEDLSPPSDDE